MLKNLMNSMLVLVWTVGPAIAHPELTTESGTTAYLISAAIVAAAFVVISAVAKWRGGFSSGR